MTIFEKNTRDIKIQTVTNLKIEISRIITLPQLKKKIKRDFQYVLWLGAWGWELGVGVREPLTPNPSP